MTVQEKATFAQQTRNNDQVVEVGSLQVKIARARSEYIQLVAFLGAATTKLVRAAGEPSQDAALAGLLVT